MLHLLLVLSLPPGCAGFAYEILYARLLTTYLGDMFFVVSRDPGHLFCWHRGGIAAGAPFRPLAVDGRASHGLYAALLATMFSVFGQQALRSLYADRRKACAGHHGRVRISDHPGNPGWGSVPLFAPGAGATRAPAAPARGSRRSTASTTWGRPSACCSSSFCC